MITSKTDKELYSIPTMVFESGSIGYMERLFLAQLIIIANAQHIIETGSFKGQTTIFLSQLLKQNNMEGKIYSFDLPDVVESIRKNEPYFQTADNVSFIGGSLPQTLHEHLDRNRHNPLDFAIVDSEHTYRQVKVELNTIHPFLKPGAYVFCHDYRESDEKYQGVVSAVDEFAAERRYSILPLAGKMVWGAAVLRKKCE